LPHGLAAQWRNDCAAQSHVRSVALSVGFAHRTFTQHTGAGGYVDDIAVRLFLLFSDSLASVAIACFLLAIIHGAPEGVRYRSPILRSFGQISYALYLIHQPISGLLHGLLLGSVPDIGTPAQIGVTFLSVAMSIGVAVASWKWLESPILAWAQSYRYAPPGLSRGPMPAAPHCESFFLESSDDLIFHFAPHVPAAGFKISQ
jgi:peptidoglycan/LPS O-acetylase OafA/YrhL